MTEAGGTIGDDEAARSGSAYGVARVTSELLAFPGEDQECGYLPGRTARFENFATARLCSSDYRVLLDANFRRAGVLFYRPRCAACSECRQMRVLVDEFEPSRSQRRCRNRNSDLRVRAARPRIDDEKVALYASYVRSRHAGGPQSGSREELEDFLYRTTVPALEVEYRLPDGRLAGVSILDCGDDYASSVYHYFDPAEARRSLGVFSVIAEIAFCRSRRIPHYYLGYLVRGARTMEYKARYRPFELLVDGNWVRK